MGGADVRRRVHGLLCTLPARQSVESISSREESAVSGSSNYCYQSAAFRLRHFCVTERSRIRTSSAVSQSSFMCYTLGVADLTTTGTY